MATHFDFTYRGLLVTSSVPTTEPADFSYAFRGDVSQVPVWIVGTPLPPVTSAQSAALLGVF